MKNPIEKTFSTGEFAKLLEINKDTLLYYDKIDLFKPAGTHPNGYRYYTFEQFELDGDVYEEYLLHSIATKEEEEYITKISVKVKRL